MDSKIPIKRLAILIIFIFLLNFLANTFYWYYSIWWFDMPMHFLGGFWIGLGIIYLLKINDFNSNSIIKILTIVLIIGLGWEVFEYLFNNYLAQNPFSLSDTLSDIFFDLAGGASAVLFFSKRIMLQSKDDLEVSL